MKRAVATFSDTYQITAVAFADAGDQVIGYIWGHYKGLDYIYGCKHQLWGSDTVTSGVICNIL